nr:hypothetical protein [uncultured bacterium]
MIRMNQNYPWEKGLFQVLEVPSEKLNFTIPHPILESVNFQTDYNAIRCALWANSHTFSFEPFMQNVIKPSETVSWGVTLA